MNAKTGNETRQTGGGGGVEGKADHKNRFFLHCTEEFELLKKSKGEEF